jgi:hypothetical protein
MIAPILIGWANPMVSEPIRKTPRITTKETVFFIAFPPDL